MGYARGKISSLLSSWDHRYRFSQRRAQSLRFLPLMFLSFTIRTLMIIYKMYQIPVYLISNSDPSLNYFNIYLLSLTSYDDYISLQIKTLLLLY